MSSQLASLQIAINDTLHAIQDGKEQVRLIVQRTLEEVRQLEQEYEAVKDECLDAINYVEEMEHKSRLARENLVTVNRGVTRYTQAEMRKAYDAAQTAQLKLGQWREREVQLRMRRDELARRLKSLRISAQEAETAVLKFSHISDYLTNEFGELASALEAAQMKSLIGLQAIQMQEDERRTLAQRLHDGPMQGLAGVAMKAQLVPVQSGQDPLKEDVRTGLSDIISEIRHIVFDLHPPLLDDLGLIPALRRYTQQWSEWTNVKVTVRLIGVEIMLQPSEKMTIFRAVQEALKNTAQHARATQVNLLLIYGVDTLTVEVLDDGVGIDNVDWHRWVEEGKLGLTMARQRMNLLNGRLDVEVVERLGTKVTVVLPNARGDRSHEP